MIGCGNPVEEVLDEVEEIIPDAAELEEEIAAEKDSNYIKMDFTLQTPAERVEKVKEIIANTPSERLTHKYLEKLSDYIIFAMDKEERKQKKIITDNRLITINDRETSFEGLISKLENGEDGIYNMIANDKNIIFKPKVSITEKDLEEIPELRKLKEAIDKLEELSKTARGKNAYLLKKTLIEMRKDQYVIKNAYKKPMYSTSLVKSIPKMDLTEHITVDADGRVKSDGLINFFNEEHISALLCNYSKIKSTTENKLQDDAKWLMMDFDVLIEKTLKYNYPMYYDLVICKIAGMQNAEIQEYIYKKHNVKHTVEYISSLWRNKIPKLLVEQATNDWLIWHYTHEEYGKWKKCSRCGEIKLAHNNFFSKNKTSKDGWYSICKCCRNKKK